MHIGDADASTKVEYPYFSSVLSGHNCRQRTQGGVFLDCFCRERLVVFRDSNHILHIGNRSTHPTIATKPQSAGRDISEMRINAFPDVSWVDARVDTISASSVQVQKDGRDKLFDESLHVHDRAPFPISQRHHQGM